MTETVQVETKPKQETIVIPKTKKQRAFSGFKADLRASLEGLTLSIPIKGQTCP